MGIRPLPRLLLIVWALTCVCGAASPSSVLQPSSNAPTINQITPAASPVGTVVTVQGNNFASANNVVKFGAGYIRNIDSQNGTTLSFSVPDGLDLCAPEGMGPCQGAYPRVGPGEYAVAVVSQGKASNSVKFTVTE
jgi:hypothetical protein